ncbi:MAG: hypothetical protein LUH46_10720, partial [Alistipes sp.]|nr:hypothetical protein [Alistipes sp.]
MTGKKSSTEDHSKSAYKARPALHDLGYVVGRNYWLFLITAAVFMVTMPVHPAGVSGDSIFNIDVTHDQLKFRLIHDSYLAVVLAGAVVLGMIGGIASFRFLQDKKETTIFFSLGLTRMRLFANRCVSGMVMLFLGIAIPMLVSMGLNIRALGVYDGLIRNTFYLTAGLTVTAVFSFLAAAIVSALAGTMAETIIDAFSGEREHSMAALCVLGGIFSEGIDLKRNRLIGVLIVGTGLPQICSRREVLKSYYSGKKEGFPYAYQYPGMNKVL